MFTGPVGSVEVFFTGLKPFWLILFLLDWASESLFGSSPAYIFRLSYVSFLQILVISYPQIFVLNADVHYGFISQKTVKIF